MLPLSLKSNKSQEIQSKNFAMESPRLSLKNNIFICLCDISDMSHPPPPLSAIIVEVKNHKFVLAVTSDRFYPTGPLTSQSALIKIVIIPAGGAGAGAK